MSEIQTPEQKLNCDVIIPDNYSPLEVSSIFESQYLDLLVGIEPTLAWEIVGMDLAIFESLNTNKNLDIKRRDLNFRIVEFLSGIKNYSKNPLTKYLFDAGYDLMSMYMNVSDKKEGSTSIEKYIKWRSVAPFRFSQRLGGSKEDLEFFKQFKPIRKQKIAVMDPTRFESIELSIS